MCVCVCEREREKERRGEDMKAAHPWFWWMVLSFPGWDTCLHLGSLQSSYFPMNYTSLWAVSISISDSHNDGNFHFLLTVPKTIWETMYRVKRIEIS
jgi:hypothetical protein